MVWIHLFQILTLVSLAYIDANISMEENRNVMDAKIEIEALEERLWLTLTYFRYQRWSVWSSIDANISNKEKLQNLKYNWKRICAWMES